MLRLPWTQPEDLVPHALLAAEADGKDVSEVRRRWVDAGGSTLAPVNGSTPVAPPQQLRELARVLLDRIDEIDVPDSLRRSEPDDLDAALELAPDPPALPTPRDPANDHTLRDRMRGAWLGRAAGCLLGKPVEKLQREAIRAIAQSTGNWPIAGYFTAAGLDPDIAAAYEWNRRSKPTSLAENIDGMPEDDDMNFPLIALGLLEESGRGFDVDDVAKSWLSNLPGGLVFTAERIVYRDLLDGYEPAEAASVRNPFSDWIGAQIRTDVYGWVNPGDPLRAARLAWVDGWLTHRRSGLYGAMFAAAACSAALVTDSVETVVAAGLSVVPADSRYATAIRFGAEIGRGDLDDEAALDALAAEYGHVHWVHALNNSALLAFAVIRSGGDFTRAISLAVTGGWDTDSVGATVGSICGALAGASGLPASWIEPLHGRLASSIPGFDGVHFDELAERTIALI
jgi:ADP-ribosylglycohydrolase